MNVQDIPERVEVHGPPSRCSTVTLLCSHGEEYQVKVRKDHQGSATFVGTEWVEFLNENRVNRWTILLMERLSGDSFSVKVCKPRHVGDRVVWSPLQEDSYGEAANPIYVADDTEDDEYSLGEIGEESEGSSNKNNSTGEDGEGEVFTEPSSFDVKLTSFHVTSSYLTVPTAFVRECDIRVKRIVHLRTENGTFTLEVHSFFDARYPDSPQVVFRNSWRDFVSENDMEVGQVIVFTVLEFEPFSDLLVMDVEVTDP